MFLGCFGLTWVRKGVYTSILKLLVFFGYSFGALLAFEVSRELRKQNMKLPNYLFVAVMHASQAVPVHPPLSKLAGDKFLQQIEHYYQPQDEVWSNPDLREIFLPVLRDDRGAPLALTQRWPEQTSSQMNHHVFKGGHFFINTSLSEIQNLVLKTLKPLL